MLIHGLPHPNPTESQKIEVVIVQSEVQEEIPFIDQNAEKVKETSKKIIENNCHKTESVKSSSKNNFTIFSENEKNSRGAIICCLIMAAALIILRQVLPHLDESEY